MIRRIWLILGLLLVLACPALAYVPNGANTDLGGEYEMKLPYNFRRKLTYYPGYVQVADKVFDMVEIRDIESKESDSNELVAVGTVRQREDGRLILRLDFGAEGKYSCDHNCGMKRKYPQKQQEYLYEIAGGEGSLTIKPLTDEGNLPLIMSAEGNYRRSQRELYALTDAATLYALEGIPGANYPGWFMQAWRHKYQYEIDWAMDYFYSKTAAMEKAAGREYRGGMVVKVFDEQGEIIDRLTTDSFAEHIYRIGKDNELSLVVDRRIE